MMPDYVPSDASDDEAGYPWDVDLQWPLENDTSDD